MTSTVRSSVFSSTRRFDRPGLTVRPKHVLSSVTPIASQGSYGDVVTLLSNSHGWAWDVLEEIKYSHCHGVALLTAGCVADRSIIRCAHSKYECAVFDIVR